MANITKEQLSDLTDVMKDIVGDGSAAEEQIDTIIRLLSVPDSQFEVLAPGIMQSYQQSVNNPNDKLALAQALNATGEKADDLISGFETIVAEIDKTSLSTQKRDFLKELISTVINAVVETEGIAKRTINIPIELCHPDAKIPQYAHISDSGMDVYAVEDIVIEPGETVLVPTGIKIALPPGYEIQVRPKSGRALKTKLRVANTPGTIDQGYRDEIKVIIDNLEPKIKDISYKFDDDGNIKIDSVLHGNYYVIGKGEKFCQLVLSEVPKASFYRVDNILDFKGDRGGGFGSTSIYSKDDERYKTDLQKEENSDVDNNG